MTSRRRSFQVLVVDTDRSELARHGGVLTAAGYTVALASSYEEAKQRLSTAPPDVLIVDVQLGAFNGLQLVTVCSRRASPIAAVVTGSAHDSVVERDARSVGARSYLPKPIAATTLLAAMSTVVTEARPGAVAPGRRWPRKPIPRVLPVRVAERPATLLDVSYGGLAFATQTPLVAGDVRPPTDAARVAVEVPDLDEPLTGDLVWRVRAGGAWRCGLRLAAEATTATGWRAFVDRV